MVTLQKLWPRCIVKIITLVCSVEAWFQPRGAVAGARGSNLEAMFHDNVVQLLKRYCDAIMHKLLSQSNKLALEIPALAEPIPPRLYSDEQLARMSGISTTIKCECPHHLAELIMALNAFEVYSANCENRNIEDAALHTYLHHSTAQARQIMEHALEHLIEVENISSTL